MLQPLHFDVSLHAQCCRRRRCAKSMIVPGQAFYPLFLTDSCHQRGEATDFYGVSDSGTSPCTQCPKNSYVDPNNLSGNCLECSTGFTAEAGSITSTDCLGEHNHFSLQLMHSISPEVLRFKALRKYLTSFKVSSQYKLQRKTCLTQGSRLTRL